jgi:hypothetical protein
MNRDEWAYTAATIAVVLAVAAIALLTVYFLA